MCVYTCVRRGGIEMVVLPLVRRGQETWLAENHLQWTEFKQTQGKPMCWQFMGLQELDITYYWTTILFGHAQEIPSTNLGLCSDLCLSGDLTTITHKTETVARISWLYFWTGPYKRLCFPVLTLSLFSYWVLCLTFHLPPVRFGSKAYSADSLLLTSAAEGADDFPPPSTACFPLLIRFSHLLF